MITRKNLLMVLFLISCSIHVIAQTDYYYYKGKKIPLTLNENKVIISIPKEYDETIERIRAKVQALVTIEDEIFDILVIARSDFEKLTSQDSWKEDAKSVILTSSYFSERNEEVYTTPYLTVRLKKEEDKDLLVSCAEKYSLKIVKQDSFMPLYYILSLTPGSEKNSLQCANELYESGYFSSSQPDFCDAKSDIESVRSITITQQPSSNILFDLQGRVLSSKPVRGIYIKDGKKVVVK
ncbi:MAG: hypothetical protein J5767_12190 [Paludibacteraceae bacterium]|nr:hypothetical protein [Paludibacteraceae bacterium]